MRAGIVGGSGYLGGELLRLLAAHPGIDVASVQGERSSGELVAALHPGLAAAYPATVIGPVDERALTACDVVFCALPSGASQDLVAALSGRIRLVVDLGADFRLHDAAAYRRWYGFEHRAPELLGRAVYGLPELYRKELAGASLIASPGCYPTAVALALEPLLAGGLIERQGLVIDAASGISGAGREPSPRTHFGTANESFVAYGLLDHRHTPEIEQTLGAQVLFTPHLAPMSRGILVTAYGRSTKASSTEELLDYAAARYRDEPFVEVVEHPPATSETYGANLAKLTYRADPRTGWVIALAAIDNLTKGGAGQAIQAANVALGFEETAGLSRLALWP